MPIETINMAKAGKEPFKATPEELRSIQERMKDPKFVQLMSEYMESLSDPETRAEEEAYLEQAEREAKEGGDYTFDFIFPRPVFAVELAKPTTTKASDDALKKLTGDAKRTGGRSTTGVRSFVNFCVSDKVEEFKEETTGDVNGSRWHVPVAVCEKRLEYYYENRTKPKSLTPMQAMNTSDKTAREAYVEVQSAAAKVAATPPDSAPFCYVYDAVFHPKTLSLADRSNRFLCFLVEIAVEHINAGYKESNGFEFSRLSSSIICVGYPKNQTIRKKGKESPFAVDPTAPVLTKPTKHMDAAASTKTKTTASASGVKTAAAPTKTPPPLPPVTIKHRGTIDMADSWDDHRVFDKKIGVPEVLVVNMDFSRPPSTSSSTGPAVTVKASAIDIAVTEDGTALRLQKTAGQPYYEGLVVLPFSVEEDPLRAKFDKNQRILTLELKVQAHHLRQKLSRPPAEAITTTTSEATAAAAPSPNPESSAASPDPSPAMVENTTNVTPVTPPPPPPAPAAAATETTASSETKTEAETEGNTMSTAMKEEEEKTETETKKPQEEQATTKPKEGITATSEVPLPPPPVSQDNERLKEMFAKVEAARKAREEALAAAAKEEAAAQKLKEEVKRREEELQKTIQEKTGGDPKSLEPPKLEDFMKEAKEKEEHEKKKEVNTKEAASSVESSAPEEVPFIQKKSSATDSKMKDLMSVGQQQQDEALRALEQQQSAWMEKVQESMQAAEAEETKEVEAAARRARREAEKAKERYEAILAQEKLEEKAMARRAAAPLLNAHVFTID